MTWDFWFALGAFSLGAGLAQAYPDPQRNASLAIAIGFALCVLAPIGKIVSAAREARRERAEQAKRGVITTTIREEK